MQNQNVHSWSWGQGTAAPFPSGQPALPTTFAPTGVDQNSLFTNYQQMYGNSPGQPPADYSQWTSAQFQQWQQWQQWQEKYQQWQAQYGKKYAESLAAMGQNPSLLIPGFPSAVPPVGVPKPVEPVTINTNANPPLPSNAQPVPPPPPEEEKPPLPSMKDISDASKIEFNENLEELSEAEKTFDVQFKQWESEFEEWKKQNQDHPDKAQYKEYEKKWEAWREQLLQRLEQMRKKRLEKASEANKGVKTIDIKGKSTTTGLQGNSTETDYGYRTQPPLVPQGPFSSEPLKFDKPPPISQSGPPLSNFNQRANLNQDKNMSQDLDPNRGISFLSNQNFHRSLETFEHFDSSQEGSSSKLGNFEGNALGVCSSQKFRNPGQFESPRFGNFENLPPRRFDERNSGPPVRFSGENFRNERNFGRGFEGDKGLFGIDNRQGPLPKPKVPSLFDIQVEKPMGLLGPNGDRKPKIWEKHDDFEKKAQEVKPWGNNSWPKNAPSPWMQPWELEKMAAQKPAEIKPWERDPSQSENSPWLKDSTIKRDLNRAELSGYVGNILAKLGNVNVMPPNLGSKFEEPPDKLNDDTEKKNWNKGFSQKIKEEAGKCFPQGSQDQSENNFRNETEQDKDLDRLEPCIVGKGNEFSERMLPRGLNRFDDSAQFSPDNRNLDIDDRVPDKFHRDARMPFGRDERSFLRANDRRNFSNDDRFLERGPFTRGLRDDRGFGGKFSREDIKERFSSSRNGRRGFDRFDRDEREGRGFDRQTGGGCGGVGPIEKFGRHDQLNEPVWKPQVFDYSQGRPLRLTDLEEGFKISTVVDYSHGENKQTFDYGHGDGSKNKFEMKSTDYTVIDYGHGVDPNAIKGDKARSKEEKTEGGLRGNSEAQSPMKRSRSPKSLRSRSRSPHSRMKRNSVSPPFKNLASRNRDRIGRLTLRNDRHCSEDKVSPSDGDVSKHSFTLTTVLVEDLICRPGRESRPNKLVFIMRGLPGSGKTYVTKLIKDKEIELGGDPPRILSLDDYFMTEVEKETIDPETGRKVKAKTLEYEYEAAVEPHYRGSLVKAFKKTVSDGFFSFIIVDSVNEKTKDYEEMWSFAKQKGFQVYIAEMDNDVTVCTGRNIHKRTEKEISDLAKVWEETPIHYLRLDVRSLLQSDAITEVEMEVVSDTELDKSIGKEVEEEENDDYDYDDDDDDDDGDDDDDDDDDGDGDGDDDDDDDVGDDAKEEKEEEEDEDEEDEKEDLKDEKKEVEEEDEPGVSAFVKSRWDQFEKPEQNLDRLDGLKRRREGFHTTMEDYLQLPDDFDQDFQESVPGKKRVRWADLEERRQQEKMRAIGFVVGQTDWSRMTDPTFGESALTRTKYI